MEPPQYAAKQEHHATLNEKQNKMKNHDDGGDDTSLAIITPCKKKKKSKTDQPKTAHVSQYKTPNTSRNQPTQYNTINIKGMENAKKPSPLSIDLCIIERNPIILWLISNLIATIPL